MTKQISLVSCDKEGENGEPKLTTDLKYDVRHTCVLCLTQTRLQKQHVVQIPTDYNCTANCANRERTSNENYIRFICVCVTWGSWLKMVWMFSLLSGTKQDWLICALRKVLVRVDYHAYLSDLRLWWNCP